MPDKLPKGWVRTKYREVTRHHSGTGSMIKGKLHDSPREGRIPAYSASGQDVWADVYTGDGDAIIVSAIGARCGKAFLASGKWAAIANTHVVWPETMGVDVTFLWYRLNDEHFWERGGTAQPFVLVNKSLDREFSLPPLAEQKRIVEKLEVLLSGVAAGEAAARRALARIKRYRAAVLHAAVTGELTSDWRKTHEPDETGSQLLKRLLQERRAHWEVTELKRLVDTGKPPKDEKWKERYPEPIKSEATKRNTLPKGWTEMTLDQLTIHLTSGSRDWSKYYDRGNGTFLMAQNIRSTGLDLSYRQAVDPPAKGRDRERSQVAKDDILVTIVGANTGEVCVVPKELPEHFVCQSVALMRLADPSLSRFVWLYLAADEDGQKQWRKMIYGAGRPHLSFEHLRITTIPVPPQAEKNVILREVEQRLSASDRLAATLQSQLDRASVTRKSLLREAFIGKLVAQDPHDEPASVILDRIKATREVEANNTKTKRMPKAKATPTRRPLLDVLHEHKKPITPEQLFRDAGFEPREADLFYRELASLRKMLQETKPMGAEASAWPFRAKVLLQLKKE